MLNKTPQKALTIHRGAPAPLTMRCKDKASNTYKAFPAGLTLKAKARGSTLFTLTVGQGITLAPHAGVDDAFAVFLPTVQQSLLVPEGSFASYEITHSTPPQVVMAGTLTGEGDGT